MRLTRTDLANYLLSNNTSSARAQVAAYLVENGRTRELDQIIRTCEVKLLAKGTAVARTTSARPLDKAQEKQIESMLKKDNTIKSVEIINDVDPSLLGGVIVRTPGTEVDVSVRSRLNRLKRA